MEILDQLDKEALALLALGVGGFAASELLHDREARREEPNALVITTTKAMRVASIAVMGMGALHPLVRSQYGVISMLDDVADILDDRLPAIDDDDDD